MLEVRAQSTVVAGSWSERRQPLDGRRRAAEYLLKAVAESCRPHVDLDELQDPERLAALRRLALANLEPEEPFDRFTRLAAAICSAPTALITFVGADREHFKSSRGLPEPLASLRQTPLDPFDLPIRRRLAAAPRGARREAATPCCPPIWRSPSWACAAYAGAPLITSEGHCLGTISVLDWKPREWTDEQVAMLQDLAATAVTELELRRELADHGADRAGAEGQRGALPLAHRSDVRHHRHRGRERGRALRQSLGRAGPWL